MARPDLYQKADRVIRALRRETCEAQDVGVTPTQLARTAGVGRSTALRYLACLAQMGHATCFERGRYKHVAGAEPSAKALYETAARNRAGRRGRATGLVIAPFPDKI